MGIKNILFMRNVRNLKERREKGKINVNLKAKIKRL